MKLVRDKVPEVLTDGEPVFNKAPESRRKELLTQKLLEEVAELIVADDRDQVLKESADVIEVVLAIAKAHGHDRLAPFIEAAKKLEGRGGFDELILLEFEKKKTPPSPPPRQHDYVRFDGPGYSG